MVSSSNGFTVTPPALLLLLLGDTTAAPATDGDAMEAGFGEAKAEDIDLLSRRGWGAVAFSFLVDESSLEEADISSQEDTTRCIIFR